MKRYPLNNTAFGGKIDEVFLPERRHRCGNSQFYEQALQYILMSVLVRTKNEKNASFKTLEKNYIV
jgi:hypothetical protein